MTFLFKVLVIFFFTQGSQVIVSETIYDNSGLAGGRVRLKRLDRFCIGKTEVLIRYNDKHNFFQGWHLHPFAREGCLVENDDKMLVNMNSNNV